MNIRISDARPDDAAAIIVLMNLVGGESDNLTFGRGEFFIKDEAEESAFIEHQRELGGFTLLAWAEFSRKKGGPRLIGLLSVDVTERARLRHRAVLELSVLKEFWNQGVGTRLMQRAISGVENNQAIEVLALEVRTDNERAIRIYKRFGFEQTGINRGLLKVDGELHDTCLMSRLFHRSQPAEGRPLFYLSDVVDAIEGAGDYLEWYACMDTGEVVAHQTFDQYDGSDDYGFDNEWSEGVEDGFGPESADKKWEPLPDSFDMNDMKCIRRFAYLQSDEVCDLLLSTTHRRGAYRNFKDECARHGLLNDYYAYWEQHCRNLAIAWLEAHGCIWTEGQRPRSLLDQN